MSISRHLLVRALVPLLVGVASVPVADQLYRLAGARPSDDLEGLWVGFGEGGFGHQPEVRTSADWYSGFFTVWTDELGLRRGEDDQTATRPGDHVDYLIFGDSQGFGQGVSYEESLVGAFWGILNESPGSIRRVANLSVGGHYLLNQLEIARWLRDEHGVSFDHVVLLLTPYLISTAGGYNTATVSEDGKLWGQNPNALGRAVLWAKTHTALYGVIRNAFWNMRGGEPEHEFLNFYRVDRNEERRERLARTVGEIETWARNNGGDLILVYVPLALEVDFSQALGAAQEAGVDIDQSAPWEALASVAKSLGMPLIDLRPVLESRAAAGEVLSLRGDPHYNRETSEACAAAIWEAL